MDNAFYLYTIGDATLDQIRRAKAHDPRQVCVASHGVEHVVTLSHRDPPEIPELVTVTAYDMEGGDLWTGVAPSYGTDTASEIVRKAHSLSTS